MKNLRLGSNSHKSQITNEGDKMIHSGVGTMPERISKMKANNGKGNIPERDEWQTPKWLFEKLHKQYKFQFDCCASKSNAKTKDFTDNFLIYHPIELKSWMNPPFSKAEKMFEHFFESVQQGVAIYRCDNMETKVWQDIILKKATWIFIPNKRIVYEGMEGKGSRFPSALIGLKVDPPKGLMGTLLIPNCENQRI